MLTVKQATTLAFIGHYIEAHNGVSPSFDEIAETVGTKSKGEAHRLIAALKQRGFVETLPGQARSITVLRRPGADDPWHAVMRDALAAQKRLHSMRDDPEAQRHAGEIDAALLELDTRLHAAAEYLGLAQGGQ